MFGSIRYPSEAIKIQTNLHFIKLRVLGSVRGVTLHDSLRALLKTTKVNSRSPL